MASKVTKADLEAELVALKVSKDLAVKRVQDENAAVIRTLNDQVQDLSFKLAGSRDDKIRLELDLSQKERQVEALFKTIAEQKKALDDARFERRQELTRMSRLIEDLSVEVVSRRRFTVNAHHGPVTDEGAKVGTA